MSRIISSIVLLGVLLAVLFFTVLNPDTVTLNYFVGSAPVPLSLALVIAALIGALLGVLASMGMVLRLRREVSRLQRTMKLNEKELKNLRTIPIKDAH